MGDPEAVPAQAYGSIHDYESAPLLGPRGGDIQSADGGTPSAHRKARDGPSAQGTVDYVFLKKWSWIPDSLLCCFQKAEVRNARLHVGLVRVPSTATLHETKGGADEWRVLKLVVLCIATVAAGVANNVSFVLMGNAIQRPVFLLYGTTILYSIMYCMWLALRRWRNPEKQMYRGPTRTMFITYGLTVLFLTINGVASQFADPHVNGIYQSAINQITLPLTALAAFFFLGHRFSVSQIMGAVVVFIGAMLPIIPPLVSDRSQTGASTGTTMDTPLWILCFVLSDAPSALCNVLEEYIFDRKGMAADELHYLTLTNVATIFTYAACLPLNMIKGFGTGESGSELMSGQADAWKCFFGISRPPGCQAHAWFYVMFFVVAFVIYFYLLAVVTSSQSATFQTLINALITPASILAFSMDFLVGSAAQPLNHWALASLVTIPAGIVVYKWNDMTSGEHAIIPLIARH